MWKIRTSLLLFLMCMVFIQCGSKKKEFASETTRYFTNAGLKYRHYVEIILHGDGTISGNIYEDEYCDTVEIFPFRGTKKGEKLHITFAGEKPRVGSASRWLDKPWTIRLKGQKEFLFIPFYTRNYKTQKWENREFAYEACSAENAKFK